MDTWTMKTGFPIIRVSRASPGSGVVYLSQERFLLPGAVGNDTSFWYVPISYATKGNPDFSSTNWQPKLWMDKDTVATSIILDTTEEWLIVNPDARHYYRVIYDQHFFSLIQAQLAENHTVFSLSSRSQMIDDYFKSAFADYMDIQTALNLTLYLEKEDENSVWTTALNNLRQPYNLLRDTDALQPFKDYVLRLVEAPLSRIGWEQKPTDSPVTVFLRIQLLDWACAVGSTSCRSNATTLVENWLANPLTNPIFADVQPVMFCNAISNGNPTTSANIRDKLLTEYKKLTNATRDERQLIFINALACQSDETAIESLLSQTLSDTSDVEKAKHGVALFQRVSENTVGRKVILDTFLSTARVNEIIASLGESAISSIISSISAYTTHPTIIGQVNTFIETHLNRPDLPANVKVSLENSKNTLNIVNTQWISKYRQTMKQWFEGQI